MGLLSKEYTMAVLKRGRWVLRVAGAIGAYALIRITFSKAVEDFSSKDSGWGYSVLLFGITLLGAVSAEIAVDWLLGRLIKKLENKGSGV
jgi:hypothetical protein